MTKYVKIAVPDDFDDDIVIRHSEHDETFPVWQPVYTDVLDYGFVGLVDFYGDDAAIVNAARVSYGAGTKKVREDRGLLRYLMRHLHTTPFEMVDFKFHVKAPIFVFRQWHRHRTFSINEYSARYSVMTDEMYHPTIENLKPQSRDNKQGRSDDLLTPAEYDAVMSAVDHIFTESYQCYKHILGPNENGDIVPAPEAIQNRIEWAKTAAVEAARTARRRAIEAEGDDPYPDEESLEALIQSYLAQAGVSELEKDYPGVARELARMVLPVATYSEMYWKGNLHNLFHFLNLRCDSHAQYEIRVYANAILEHIRPIVPWAVEAFEDYLLHGTRLSRMETQVLREFVQKHSDGFGEVSRNLSESLENLGASKREIQEFLARLAP